MPMLSGLVSASEISVASISLFQFVPPDCVLATSIPVGFSPHLKTEGNVFSSSFFSVLLVVTEKKHVENMYNFIRKSPVLWC